MYWCREIDHTDDTDMHGEWTIGPYIQYKETVHYLWTVPAMYVYCPSYNYMMDNRPT